MQLTRGDQLAATARAQVLARYIYRWTSDNTRRESAWAWVDSRPTIALISDAEWLAQHAFWVNKDGTLTKNRRGEPAWMVDGDD